MTFFWTATKSSRLRANRSFLSWPICKFPYSCTCLFHHSRSSIYFSENFTGFFKDLSLQLQIFPAGWLQTAIFQFGVTVIHLYFVKISLSRSKTQNVNCEVCKHQSSTRQIIQKRKWSNKLRKKSTNDFFILIVPAIGVFVYFSKNHKNNQTQEDSTNLEQTLQDFGAK